MALSCSEFETLPSTSPFRPLRPFRTRVSVRGESKLSRGTWVLTRTPGRNTMRPTSFLLKDPLLNRF
ncbi:hypothetical protein PHMEG_00040967, partial [Phytophthora megakarya]